MATKKTPAAPAAAPAAATPAAAAPAATTTPKVVVIPVDESCPLHGKAKVHQEYDAMLNQTNIGANNNKFYVLQVLEQGGKYYAWKRWGRVGETGQSDLVGPTSEAMAIKEFEGKFRDKTSNAWLARKSFVPKAGKYTLIEIDHSSNTAKEAEIEEKLRALDKETAKIAPKTAKGVAPSALHPSLEKFMHLIFDHDMFKGAMASFDIDVNKMPLGQLSKAQVQKGYKILEDLEDAINASSGARINTLSSAFYTNIPHSFGRRTPPPISTMDVLHKKVEMLNVLNDIEIAIGLQKAAEAKPEAELLPNPADEHYKKLRARLEPVDDGSDEYRWIRKYTDATAGSWRKPAILDVFRVHRDGEAERFKAHDDIDHRKLLWHGTNVAVVAAILGSGLRIMPHSGGRVGKGIYLASENGKSIGYVGFASGGIGCMFLAEAALGRIHEITRDDSSLKEAPKGYDCIVARGHTEPDPGEEITVDFDGKKVIVPQGKPVTQKSYSKSSFSQSEYLVYRESQVKLRYVLKIKA